MADSRRPRRGGALLTGLAVLGLTGFGLIVLSTRWGAGLDPDSTVYVRAARSLVAGRGVVLIAERERAKPVTRFPPLYPALLATGSLLSGQDPWDCARWVGAFFFSASILLVAVTVGTGPGPPWAALLAAALMALSPDMLRIHSMALSEATFLFLLTLTLYVLASYLDRPTASKLVVSAVAASLACLTRYAGMALVVTGVLALLLLVRGPLIRRALNALLFATLACAANVAWALRNLRIAGTTAERVLAVHPPTSQDLTSALETVSGWLLPGTPFTVRAAALTIIVIAGIAALVHRSPVAPRDQGAPSGKPLARLITLFAILYLSLLGFNITFVSADTRFDFRILSPIYVALVILVARGCARLEGRARAAAGMLLVPVLAAYLTAAVGFVRQAYLEGQGYAKRSWHESPTLAALQPLPAATPIFSNRPDAIAVLTNRPAGRIPSNYNPSTLQANPNRSAEVAQLRRNLKDRKGVVVVFKKVGVRGYLMSEAELSAALPLRLVKRTRDGSIYRWDAERNGDALEQRAP